MGMWKTRLHLNNLSNTMAAICCFLSYVLLVGLVSYVSPQRTYQRACDCEYMVNGRCAYTLLLPTGNNDATCQGGGGGGTGSEVTDSALRNMTNRVNYLYDITINQSLLLSRLQDIVIDLQRTNQQPSSSLNDSTWRARQEAALASLNATLQSGATELGQLMTTTEMLERNLTSLTSLFQRQMDQLSHLQSVINETQGDLEKRTAEDGDKISKLTDAVELLRQGSCSRRAALFSGPDRLNGTSISFSSYYNNDPITYGPQQLAIDNTVAPGAWCPREPPHEEWVQFDFGRALQVFGVATRARTQFDQWITTYTIQYVPNNSSSSSGVLPTAAGNTSDWVYFNDVAGATQVFQGNADSSSIQMNMLWRPLFTRYVRLFNLTGANGGNVCTRAEIIGCVDDF